MEKLKFYMSRVMCKELSCCCNYYICTIYIHIWMKGVFFLRTFISSLCTMHMYYIFVCLYTGIYIYIYV